MVRSRYICWALLYFLMSLTVPLVAQEAAFKYVVYFQDKDGTPYSLEDPQAFMSEKALERRTRYNIPLMENDLPVAPAYISQMEVLGYEVLSSSRWLNAILIQSDQQLNIEEVENEPFVRVVTWVSQQIPGGRSNVSVEYNNTLFWQGQYNIDYGVTAGQIDLLNGQYLHNEGWQGDDMVIGVLDAGFSNVPEIDGFNSLFQESRLLATKDMVDYDDNVFESSSHGTSVLSLMAGNITGEFLGTAPQASYILVRTEDTGSEQLVEEFNYVLGLEYADQMGVDVINTSLGYTRFNHPEMDHDPLELNGDHLIASKGADIGASKGMLVINSAGNLGDRDWQYISMPSDADSILAVGSVNPFGQRSGFSGIGHPNFPNIKPNVMSQGEEIAVLDVDGTISYGGGTSYSAPLVAGLAACLWQAFPEKNNMEIISAIERSSSQYFAPDKLMGYGIPDFQAAFALLYQEKFNANNLLSGISIFPNPFTSNISLTLPDDLDENIEINLINEMGQSLYGEMVDAANRKTVNISFSNISNLNNGIYFLQVKTIDKVFMFKMIKV
ncbi:MAG: S8 family peptidase [Chitinophagales bacterium]